MSLRLLVQVVGEVEGSVELLLLVGLVLGEFVDVRWNWKVELNSGKDLSVAVGVAFVFYQWEAVAVRAQVELLLDVVVVSHTNQQVSFHVNVHVHFRVFFKRYFAANYDALFCL